MACTGPMPGAAVNGEPHRQIGDHYMQTRFGPDSGRYASSSAIAAAKLAMSSSVVSNAVIQRTSPVCSLQV